MIRLLSLLLLLSSPVCAQHITPRLVADSLGLILRQHYVYDGAADSMAAYLKQRSDSGFYDQLTGPGALSEALYQDIQTIHRDDHFFITYSPGLAHMLTSGSNHNPPPNTLALEAENYWCKRVEVFPGNIGYVQLNGFAEPNAEDTSILFAAFRIIRYTKALVIDLRKNTGGSPFMVNLIESMFFSNKTHMNDILSKTTEENHVFWTDPTVAGGLRLNMPLYILTSGMTFSAGEDFAYAMQSIHRATIVGDTTGGGAHPVHPYPIGNGFVAAIPFARTLNPYTHTDWERVGVIPDIPVHQEDALERAIKCYYDTKSDSVAGTRIWEEKNILSYIHVVTPAQDILDSACGWYQGDVKVYARGGHLFLRSPIFHNVELTLRYVSGKEFMVMDDVSVCFFPGGLNVLHQDGSMDRLEKVPDSPRR
jgi:retinol-binding protein 3